MFIIDIVLRSMNRELNEKKINDQDNNNKNTPTCFCYFYPSEKGKKGKKGSLSNRKNEENSWCCTMYTIIV